MVCRILPSCFVVFLRQALALRSATESFSSDANAAARRSACLFSCPTLKHCVREGVGMVGENFGYGHN